MQLIERLGVARQRSLLFLLGLVLLGVGSPTLTHADEASGTWTGDVEVRGNYYWETSTRVIAPEVAARLESPDGVNVNATYLVDAITSASIAAGAQEDIRFTEIRHQASAGVNREFDLGDAQLRVLGSGRFSHEPDYLATGVNVGSVLSLNQRATLLSFNLSYIHDDVGKVLRGGETRMDDSGRDLSDRGRQGQLEGVAASLNWSQVLTPTLNLSVGYDFLHNWGYLHSPYRQARVAGNLVPEIHPDERTRHTLHSRLSFIIPETQTAIHGLMRAYIDDWDVSGITPEVRLYQMIGPSILVRARYRFYTQAPSFFYEPMYETVQPFVTADPKMSDFHSHLIGAHMRLQLGFLADSPLGFLEDAWMSMNFEYLMQTNRFGDAIIAQAGLQVPF